ncbi:serpin family protein [Sunxiuqinia elliptica]|uniref:Serpin B n=1 Tax=Sunxiuqinia elliptica TaxID=655355 RepID=A0A1I2EK93_9BACT|nr:serpin family protein [Sunxiuqinia elliptica]SFE93047.1 serpin B [Sunxiuqinia elliptica]
MKQFFFLFGLSFLMSSLISCSSEDITEHEISDIQLNDKSAQLVKADNAFGLELFKELNKEQEAGKNLMLSPLSISQALAMTYNGAEGNTKTEMEAVLHKSGFTPQQINESYQNLVNALTSHDSRVDLSISNAIFYRNGFSIKPTFISTNQTYYNAEVKGLNFEAEKATRDQVNGWVRDKTNNKIEEIIQAVNPEDIMYLINAIYFNGEWTFQFDKQATSDRTFYTSDGSEIQVSTMQLDKTTLNYSNTDSFQLLELPYGGKKYSMLIFLPNDAYTINDIIQQMNQEQLDEWVDNLHSRNLKVFLPKFEFKYENSLVDNLQTLGMTDAFSPSSANFAGISDQSGLSISEVKHKTYIKVDEKGTEAAAVTAVTVEVTSVGPDPVFNINRPFVFAIREKDTNAMLFLGKVNNPLLHE